MGKRIPEEIAGKVAGNTPNLCNGFEDTVPAGKKISLILMLPPSLLHSLPPPFPLSR
jgi:hypothetical protein